MAKYINPQEMDNALLYIQQNAVRVTLCTQQPTSYTEGITTYAIGTLATGSANFTIANGDVSGRKLSWGPGTFVIGTSGTVNHLAFLATAGSGTLLHVGTATTATAVTAAGTAIIAAFRVTEIGTIS